MLTLEIETVLLRASEDLAAASMMDLNSGPFSRSATFVLAGEVPSKKPFHAALIWTVGFAVVLLGELVDEPQDASPIPSAAIVMRDM